PFEQAFFVMVQLPYLQPFEDVNKRVSRLAANIPLIKRNLAPLSFVDVPQDIYVDDMLAIYELNRIELLRAMYSCGPTLWEMLEFQLTERRHCDTSTKHVNPADGRSARIRTDMFSG